MDTYEQLLKCLNDKEIKEFASVICDFFNNNYDNDNYYIGFDIEKDPVSFDLLDLREKILSKHDIVYFFEGYIPLGTKIVYKKCHDSNSNVLFNDGGYYFYDDENYVYEFLKYIKKIDIKNDYDIILASFHFIQNNFDSLFYHRSRDSVQKNIYKDGNFSFDRVCERSIKDLMKYKCFECTEYSIIMQNLLSIFGIDCKLVIDKNHAYNICTFKGYYSDLDDTFILDSAWWVYSYNYKLNEYKIFPYIEKIVNPSFNVPKILSGEAVFKSNNYFYYDVNNILYKFYMQDERVYGINITKDNFDIITGNDNKRLILK